MTKVENDTTRDPAPAVIIAGPRTGGTFLAHGLSNHPDVYCERQEVLHLGSSYRMIEAGLSSLDILKIVWGQSGYLVSACKLQYSQAGYGGIWEHILERGARIIHLCRRNKLRQAVSLIINQMARDGAIPFHPQHARETPSRIAVTIDARRLQATAERLIKDQTVWTSRLLESGLPVLRLSYRAVIGEGVISAKAVAPATAERICEFLGVVPHALPVNLKRINPWPLDKMIANWNDIEPLLGRPEFDGCEIGGTG